MGVHEEHPTNMSQFLCLNWAEFEADSFTTIQSLLSDTEFADVTLASHDEEQIQAHKVILCAASPFFKRIISKNPHQHPLLFLRNVGIKMLKSIIRFIYTGKTGVEKEDLEEFLVIANDLKVKGLVTENDKKLSSRNNDVDIVKSKIVEEEVISIVEEMTSNSKTAEMISGPKIIDEEYQLQKENVAKELESIYSQLKVDKVDEMDEKDRNESDKTNPVEDSYADELDEIEINKMPHEDGENKSNVNTTSDSTYLASEEKYLCNKCDYTAKFKNTLNLHIDATHKGIRYPCGQCDYKATQKSSLNRHAKRHLM